jgi:hypothetical protein
MNGRPWTKRELAVLRRRYPHEATKLIAAGLKRPISGVYKMAYSLNVKKTAAFLASSESGRLAKLTQAGAAFRFKKGGAPANKGLRRPGWGPGRMRETQFRKGERPHTWKPIGSERMMDGYLQRKMTDTGYPPRDWVAVHVLMWIEAHGPIPPKHTVCFRDKDKTHIALSNLELVSRRELMLRNSFHTNYPREIGQLIQLRGALQQQINRRERHAKQD